MTYTIEHGPEGTALFGTVKGDPITKALRSRGWLYSGRRSAWVLNSTWRFDTREHKMAATVAALRDDGHTVDLVVETAPAVTTVEDVAEREAAHAARTEARIERQEARANRLEAESDARLAAARQIQDGIPLGQPILVGHHSERRHRKDLARIDTNYRKGFDAHDEAKTTAARAAQSAAALENRGTMVSTRRRLDRLGTELRDVERNLNGRLQWRTYEDGSEKYEAKPASGEYQARLEIRQAELVATIAYWTAHLAELEAAGGKVWTRADFKPGDWARIGNRDWMLVEKANPKNLKLRSYHADGRPVMPWALDYPYTRVTGRRAATEGA